MLIKELYLFGWVRDRPTAKGMEQIGLTSACSGGREGLQVAAGGTEHLGISKVKTRSRKSGMTKSLVRGFRVWEPGRDSTALC